MKSAKSLPILLMGLISIIVPEILADTWPVEPCGRQGYFQIPGQPQTTYATNFCFHGAVDIVANENAPDKTIVRCVHTGYLYNAYPAVGKVEIILDTGVPYYIGTEEQNSPPERGYGYWYREKEYFFTAGRKPDFVKRGSETGKIWREGRQEIALL